MIAALLLGSTLVNIGGSAFTTSVLVVVAGENGAVYATIIMTVLLLVFAEVLPKTLAINHPDEMSLRVARYIAPFVRDLRAAARRRRICRARGAEPRRRRDRPWPHRCSRPMTS